MAKYFFHLYEPGMVIKDEEGREMRDFAAARHYAATAAREIVCAEVKNCAVCRGCYIEIENSDTGERHILKFDGSVNVTEE